MSISLLGAVAFVVFNVLFLLLIRRIKRIRRGWVRSAIREALFWVTMCVQLAASLRGVGILVNDGTWLGVTDDICCALGGLWLGVLALRERKMRQTLLGSSPPLPAGGARC